MTASAVPLWLKPLLRAAPGARAGQARRLLADRPWDELRRGLALALREDPAGVRAPLAALRDASDDRAMRARLAFLEGQAVHRCGRLADALRLYRGAARDLKATRYPAEAAAVGVAEVDALAGAGRVDAALALAERLERTTRRMPASTLVVTLDINRGNALRLRGDVDGAARAYARAAERARALGNAHLADIASVNEGVALVEAGDPASARTRFTAAAERFSARGAHDFARDTRMNVAWADLHAGRVGEAVRTLDALATEFHAAGASRREGVSRVDLADALRRAGDGEGAEREAQRAAAAFAAADARAEEAEALWVAAASAPPVRAARHLASARRRAVASGRPALVLRCDVLLADLAARQGTPPRAAALAALERRARALGQRALAADVALLAATGDLAAGRTAAAARRFRAVLATSGRRPWTRFAAETGLARVEGITERGRGRAIARLRRVAAWLDAVRAGLPGAWLRAQFVAERLDPYLARVDLLLGRGRPADRREAEALLDAMQARRFLGARTPAVEDRRLRRIRARLEAIYDRLARGEGPTRGAESDLSSEATLERRARAWESAAAAAWQQRERREAPLFDRTDVPRAASVARDVAVVHLWRAGARLAGLVRIGDDVGTGVDLGAVEDLEGLTLSLRIRAHRWAFLRRTDDAATDPRAIERVLAEVADSLLPGLDAGRWPAHVRIAADPTLPDVPWEMLPFDGVRLGQVHRILRVPAGASWARPRPAGIGTVVLGVGDPNLPGVDREIAAIAAAAGAARVVQGASATRAAVTEALSTAQVVHLAGHGWDAEQAPPLGGVRLADGWFSAADLPPGGVVADLVVLAACRTGRAAGRAALAWGGLVRALLSAGARRVVWTMDDVDDSATARFMTLFHEARRSSDDASAFGSAAAGTAAEAGHVGAVLAFRLSGVAP